jgi:rhodanese-related sulfurtransferase
VIAEERDHLTAEQLSDWIIRDQRDYELVDIRDQAEYEQDRIPGARNIPLSALMSDDSLASLPLGRKVVIYSNGTAHAAQAALLLRLVERDAYALLGGFNYWQAYTQDPQSAGVAEMDAAKQAQYRAVSCFFEGDYVAEAGLLPQVDAKSATNSVAAGQDADPLGLGLGLGSDEVRGMGLDAGASKPAGQAEDPLGLGLGLGLGGEAAEALRQDEAAKPAGSARKLLIKAEC